MRRLRPPVGARVAYRPSPHCDPVECEVASEWWALGCGMLVAHLRRIEDGKRIWAAARWAVEEEEP